MRIVEVKLSSEYNVIIGKGAIEDLSIHLPVNKYERILLLMDTNVERLYGERITNVLINTGRQIAKYVIEAGEKSKSFHELERLLNFMVNSGITRSDALLAFGGGVPGDLGGFAAGVYQRGIDLIQVPTTLLSAVDSSVGGKSAVNMESGKNMAGIFKQPAFVICDTSLFNSLANDEFSSGVAEVIKYAVLFDKDLFERVKQRLSKGDKDLDEIVEKCVQFKANIVSEDEFDKGKRHLLNLGHTFGHAIERASGYSVVHGNAVAMGLDIMARACLRKGITDLNTVCDIETALSANGLPVNTSFTSEELIKYAKMDKKSNGNSIDIVVIKGIEDCKTKRIDFEELGEFANLGVIVDDQSKR